MSKTADQIMALADLVASNRAMMASGRLIRGFANVDEVAQTHDEKRAALRTAVEELERERDGYKADAKDAHENWAKNSERAERAEAENARLRRYLREYIKAIDDIYNHNAAARAAVVHCFGISHGPDVLEAVRIDSALHAPDA